MEKKQNDGKNGLYLLAAMLLAGPFYLNDFAGVIPKSVFIFFK